MVVCGQIAMSSTLVKIAVGLIALVALLFIKDIWHVEAYKYRSRKRGYGVPLVVSNRPFGIFKLLEAIKRNKNHTMLGMNRQDMIARGVRTTYEQRLFNYVVVTVEPENIKTVLATSFKDYSLGMRRSQIGPLIGDGIFTLSGEGWKHSRTMLRPQFSREQVCQLDSLRAHVDVLLSQFKTNSAAGYFDAQKLFFMLTLDTASEFLFGESTNALAPPPTAEKRVSGNPVSGTQFASAFQAGLETITMRLIMGIFYWTQDSREFRDAANVCKRFIDYFVQEALASTADGATTNANDSEHDYVFIRELAKETRDPVVIRDQAFNILLAGRDTTASLLSYTVWHLAQDPRVLRKLREAVLETFGTDPDTITFESLKRCEYLGHVLNEVLRVNPVVPVNFRTAIRDTVLPRGGGPDESQPVLVPKDTVVAYSVYTLHRDEAFWGADSEEFRPERWAEHRSRTWEYLPFNGGPRICLGQQFALTEAGFTIVRLMQTFSGIELDPSLRNTDIRHALQLTSNVATGVPVKFIV